MRARSYVQKKEDVVPQWKVVDAKDQVVGRLASQIAISLRGKDKASFTPHVDGGDFVVVINADKIRFTGNKLNAKNYYSYSGYKGGLKTTSAKDQLKNNPELVIKSAVKGMLPKGPLGRQIISKLKVYAGEDHPHQAQQPSPLKVNL
ncbi:MAG: 50S ribosomal protein L13 [Bdellovibrionota bacterium]